MSGLPEEREKTFEAGSQVPSDVLNNTQDAIIDLNSAVKARTEFASLLLVDAGEWSYNDIANAIQPEGASPHRLEFIAHTREGDKVSSIKMHCQDHSDATVTMEVFRSSSGGSVSQVGIVSSDNSGSVQELEIAADPPEEMDDGRYIHIRVSVSDNEPGVGVWPPRVTTSV